MLSRRCQLKMSFGTSATWYKVPKDIDYKTQCFGDWTCDWGLALLNDPTHNTSLSSHLKTETDPVSETIFSGYFGFRTRTTFRNSVILSVIHHRKKPVCHIHLNFSKCILLNSRFNILTLLGFEVFKTAAIFWHTTSCPANANRYFGETSSLHRKVRWAWNQLQVDSTQSHRKRRLTSAGLHGIVSQKGEGFSASLNFGCKLASNLHTVRFSISVIKAVFNFKENKTK
jgi:hypothetical protein